jgi:chemotaxis protein methyltransferase CheR
VSGRRPTAAALRRALRLAFGLALEGLSDEQVLAAAGAALDGSHPALAPAGRLAQVVDRLPIDESWMFRDEPLWAWLRADLLPALLAAALERGRPLRAVSLGCAGGQETHSLAILALRLLLDMGVPSSGAAAHVRLRGVDASPGRVALAASGLASAWSVQRCPPGWLGERVRCEDPAAGRWRVDAAVRSLCRFEVGNLLDAAAPGSQALRGEDLVLCRHVLIYFRPEEAATAVVGLAAALDPGAVLVLSPAESHFAAGLPGLEPLGMVGAFRARPVAVAEPAVPRRDAPSARRPRAPRAEAGRPSRPAAPRRAERPAETASRLARAAVEHAAAGRPADALREARAACFHDPRHLFSRLVLGRELMAVDRYRGRAVLAELLDLAVTLPAEAEVPHAPGLSVGQLTTAARLLMQRGEP